MTSIQNKDAAATLRQLGARAEGAGEGAARGLATLAKSAIDVASGNMKEGVIVAGSTWVAIESFQEAIKAINGQDVAGFLKPQSSGTDQAVAIGAFTAAGLVASGLAVRYAFDIAANLVDAAKKKD